MLTGQVPISTLSKMKKLLLLLPLTFFSVPVQAQQTNIYQVCTTYQENYAPGYYDRYGNYVQGNVGTNSYNTQCGTGTYYRPNNGGAAYASPVSQPVQQPRRTCAITALSTIGGGYVAYRATDYVPNRWWAVPLGAVTGGIIGNGICNYMNNRYER
jgi:hypothetical protein